MEITSYTVEKIEDPFGILSGDRYEINIHIDVDEEDELYSEKGVRVKVLYVVDENGPHISHYHIVENTTDKVFDFELDEDEEKTIEEFCRQHYTEE